MANKVYPDAKAALAGLLHDGMLIMAGGFGLCGIPSGADRGDPRQRGEGPDHRLQQCRHRRCGARHPAADAAGQEDDQLLCRRERDLHEAVSGRRAGDRVQPAGHAGRAHPRRRRRHPGLLHPHRRRHRDRRGQGGARVRRPSLHHGARPVRRPGDRACLEGAIPRATSSTGGRRGTSTRTWRPRRRSPSPKSSISCSPARSIPTTSSPRASSSNGSCTCPNADKRIEQRTTRKRAEAAVPAAAGTDALPA